MFLFGDTLIRIKNAKLAGKEELEVSYSNLVFALIEILKEVGFIKDYKVFKSETLKKIKISLEGSDLSMVNVKLLSKPGRRLYINLEQVKRRKRKIGFYLISTPKGLMTDVKAIKSNQGGEVLCRIW